MLEKLRDASKTWVATILIGMLVVSFAIFGINDIFSRSHSTTLASVGNADIDAREFDSEFQRRSKRQLTPEGRPMTPNEARAAGFDRVVLNDMIAESAVLQEAARKGIVTSEAMTIDYINQIPGLLGPTGKLDANKLAQILQEQGMSEAQLIDVVRGDLTRQQLLEGAMVSAPASRGLAQLMQAYGNERRTVEYVVLPPEKAGDIPAPDDTALKTFIDADPAPWTAPEIRAVTVLAVGPKDLESTIQISDADVKAAYDAKKAIYETAETRELQQIHFASQEEAAAARSAIDGGKTFEQVAAEKKLAAADINLGTITKGDTSVPEAVFDLPEGQVSQPLQGPFGWVLIKVLKVTPGTSKSFDDVKGELRDQMALEQAVDKVYPYQDQIDDALAAGSTLDEIGKQLKIPVTKFAALDAKGNDADGKPVTGIPDGDIFLRDVFVTESGEQSGINQTQGHVLYVVHVDSVTPSAPRPLDKIRDAVTAAWRTAEQAKRLKGLAGDVAARATQANMSLGDVGKEAGGAGKTSEPLARGKDAPDLSPALIETLFSTPKGVWIAGDGAMAPAVVVARVKESALAAGTESSADEKTYRTLATRQVSAEMADAYRAAIVAATPVEINEQLFNSARDRTQ